MLTEGMTVDVGGEWEDRARGGSDDVLVKMLWDIWEGFISVRVLNPSGRPSMYCL